MLKDKLVELAKKEVGVEEVDGTNCGVRVNQYKDATWLDEKKNWPWCAAFICFLFQQGMKDKKYTFERPQTPSAYGFEGWCLNQDRSVLLKRSGKISKGDIVIFNFSHIGIAIEDEANGVVLTIEGNTDQAGSREGGGVYIKQRKRSLIRSFIKVMV
jgi:ribosomal protein S6E (S10)